MRVWISGFLMAWAPVVVVAETSIEDVIGAQIQAFQQDDFGAAFEFASPSIRRIFGSAETFGNMVQRGYPMVRWPDEVRYLDRRKSAGELWQRVLIRDRDGVLHVLDYQMVLIDGEWRINAVQVLPAQGVGA